MFIPQSGFFYSSLKQKSEFYANPIALPKLPSFGQFAYIFQKSAIMLWLFNTMRNTVVSLFFIVLFGFLLGYLISRVNFRGKSLAYTYFLFGMLVPIHAIMVPMYILFTNLGLKNAWFTLVLPYTAFGFPITIFFGGQLSEKISRGRSRKRRSSTEADFLRPYF